MVGLDRLSDPAHAITAAAVTVLLAIVLVFGHLDQLDEEPHPMDTLRRIAGTLKALARTAYNESPTIVRALVTIAVALGFVSQDESETLVTEALAVIGGIGYLLSWLHVRRQIDGPVTRRERLG